MDTAQLTAGAFDPTKVQDSTASLRISSDDPASPTSVALTGHGYGGVAASSRTTSADDGFPDWYQDERGVRLSQCIDPTDPNCCVDWDGDGVCDPPPPPPCDPTTDPMCCTDYDGDGVCDPYPWPPPDCDPMTDPDCNGVPG